MLGNRRSRRVREGFALAATVLVVVLGGAVALACVPQAYLVTLRPNSSGPAGSEVTVNGFNLDQGPAEVRWNGVDGPLLGQAEGPNISVPVTIPGVSTGLYAVVVISRQPSGGIGNTATVPFQVTAPGDVANDSGPPVESGDASTTVVPRVVASTSAVETGLTLAAGAGLLAAGFMAGSFLGPRRATKAPPS
jgi:hypothetical protein